MGYINLYDPETGREIAVDTSNKKLAAKYQELLDEENAKINKVFSTLRLEPVKIYTNSDIADVLIKCSRRHSEQSEESLQRRRSFGRIASSG